MGNALLDMMGSRYGNALANKSYGKRSEGSEKGSGFFGELKRPDGGISTELSMTFDRDGKPFDIPLIVPTLTSEEVSHLLNGNKPTDEIIQKALMHSRDRESRGMSPYFMPIDKISPYSNGVE